MEVAIKIDAKVLLKNVSKVASIVNSSSIMPITQNILFQTGKGMIALTGTDLETTVKVVVDADYTLDGQSVAVPAKRLLDLLKSLSGALEISFGDNKAVVKASTGKYEIGVFPGADFPKAKFTEGENSIKGYMFSHAVELVGGAVSTDDMRPNMTGVFFDSNNKKVVATDGHRLVRFDLKIAGESFIVKPKPLALLKGLQDEDVKYCVADNHIHFTTDTMNVSVRLIEGTYPPYQRVIPDANTKVLHVKSEDLAEAVKRVSLFSNAETKQIKLELGEEVKISASDLNFGTSADEKLEAKYIGQPLTIGLNARYLTELLSASKEATLKITFSEANKPVLIYSSMNPKLLQLVMPVML